MIATQTEVTELTDITIRRISVSDMDNNVYLLTSKAEGTQVLIDAADNARAIAGMVAAGSGDCSDWANLQLIVTTHSHWDHVRALEEVATHSEAMTACGAADENDIAVPMDLTFENGDTAELDGFELEVIELRGHTPGSIALVYRDPHGPAHIFTGDSLFPGGLGKTDSPEAFQQLYADVTQRIFDRFDDDTVVHPGHGAPTTLGAERPHLREWEERGW
ncbi:MULTISPECIES: MBL fold metallo-hydrolase [Kocuria]|uniref:Putative metallo-hydrolase n=1 Tax=Kocuria varians TaxID=1272 RepID=A0A7D7Q4N8_KOCVA|nr:MULTISPECIES: MBL fold metallo-hydrolase [Kocuria]MDN5632442.1 MBL fold metallo-hydrolase [Kocuria sp.]QMS57202.1 putative metallo-hydrolase [Kocuria varians]